MKTKPWQSTFLILLAVMALTSIAEGAEPGSSRGFTRLVPLPPPKITAAAPAYSGDYAAENVLKPATPGARHAEYASRGDGTNTWIEFDFGAPVRLGGFRHRDRDDPAIVAASELTFRDDSDRTVAVVQVTHVRERAGVTALVLPQPITAQRVRWKVTQLGSSHRTVGAAEMAFLGAGRPELAPTGLGIEAETVQVIDRNDGTLVQPLKVTVDQPYAETLNAIVRVEGLEARTAQLKFGRQTFDTTIAAAESGRTLKIAIDVGGATVASRAVPIPAARKLTVYLLPHSHTDIGYTEIQTEIEKKQVQNLIDGMAAAKRTASYPAGARFVWNVEVLWAADLYLRRLNESQRAEFLAAVKTGQVVLNGMYLNELTGLCRPEELLRLFRLATQLGEKTGVPVESVMISDVPGYTWGTVTAMSQAGLKYFSTAPNYFDRIGTILREWENKPFWWVGPDGRSKVLVWIPFWGYAMSHRYGQMSPQLVNDFCAGLDRRGYPYDIAYARWSGHGDNAIPDPAICEFVKDWNAKHAWPRFIISGTTEAFRALEQRYGDQLPIVRGDWTPYWEDGAGSSARETALNRASSDRLAQAETLFALRQPKAYPAARFEDAWNHVLLYSEHTWGADCSISHPESQKTREQWEIKKSYATTADRQSRELLNAALASGNGSAESPAPRTFEVFNTTSWPRTELVQVPDALASVPGTLVIDEQGRALPTQRLHDGRLAFVARNVPPLASQRFHLGDGQAPLQTPVRAHSATLDNGLIRVRVDETSGGIVELTAAGIQGNLADTSDGEALNDYRYLAGDDLKGVRRNGPVRITIRENGPLVATLHIESDAPGCHKLERDVRLIAGFDFVELINTVDKQRLAAKSYHAKEGKESLNFAFPFRVPDGALLVDVPLGAFQPDAGQMPSACKNWLTVGRWVDVANDEYGITWVTLDAPLLQIGGLTAMLLNSQTNPDTWLRTIGRSQKLYSWAMNNHWGTNYRAYQDGPTIFRYILRPHRRPNPAESTRFATAFSQPLVAVATREAPHPTPLLKVDPADVIVTGLKPSDDGKALLVRLFGASGRDQTATLSWAQPGPTQVRSSDTSERPGQNVDRTIAVPAWGLVTLRAELP